MHQSQYDTIARLMDAHFQAGSGKTVYDIGSYDVNGTHKPAVLQRGFAYVGVDIAPGPNVDVVVSPYSWEGLPEEGCEYVISGSCLEHVEAPWLWAAELERRLRPGGVCIILLPFSLGEHRYPVDCYRILPDGLRYLFTKWAQLECLTCGFNANGQDTYFVGHKP